jgi:ankyrin repeat protein
VTEQEAIVDLADDSASEEFHFPGADPLPFTVAAGKQPEAVDLVAAPAPASASVSVSVSPAPPLISSRTQKRKPSPAQLEALHASAFSGDLKLLQNLFRHAATNEDVEEFALANDASTRTGLTALHAAASRGHIDVVTWRMHELLAVIFKSSN